MPERPPIKLLLVEDDEEFRTSAAQCMSHQGCCVEQAANGQEALHLFDSHDFDVAVVDLSLPGISGLELLQRLKERNLETEVIILTGQATVETAVLAMKCGAYDYIRKPCALTELALRISSAAERSRMQRENARLKLQLERQRSSIPMIGESAPLKRVFRFIERVGPTNTAVLIEGESGTGKELVARALQQLSPRAGKPFVTINCAALPDELVESELFGHVKGAFTGADSTQPGLFEVADGGTLFIDEIGELPLSLQSKLLRVLEDGSFRRVGSHQERWVDVRLIAATNRKLQKEVAAGRFREDLYYRINVVSVALPPLRELEGDMPVLVRHFLEDGWEIDPDVQLVLEKYHWPGNIRQLSNVLQRAMVLADDRIVTLGDLPAELLDSCGVNTGGESLADCPVTETHVFQSLDALQRAQIESVLKRLNGNKSWAARTLGIHRRKLYRLLERYGIE